MALTDDQQMEYDMLQAMYPEHLSEVTTDGATGLPTYHLDVSIDVDAPNELRMHVVLPEAYPNEGTPVIRLESISTTRRIQTDALAKQLAAAAEENCGMHSVSVLLQTAQEFVRDMDSGKHEETSEMEVDPTIRLGRAVTRDLFDEWRLKHRAEKDARNAAGLAKIAKAVAGKLTGRQVWDRTLKEADWELFNGGAEVEDGDDIDYDFDMGDEEDEGAFELDGDDGEGEAAAAAEE